MNTICYVLENNNVLIIFIIDTITKDTLTTPASNPQPQPFQVQAWMIFAKIPLDAHR